MKITTATHNVNPSTELLLWVDVSKSRLNLFTRYEQGGRLVRIEDVIENRTDAIEHILPRCAGLAKEAGLRHLRILFEATGGYERKLRRPAAYCDDEERGLAAVRLRIHALTGELFPDYDKNAAFTFGATGSALMDAYSYDPFHIVRAGYKRFEKSTGRRSKYTHFNTLGHLFHCAEQSARYGLIDAEVEILTDRLKALWSDYERHTERVETLRVEIERLAHQLKTIGELPPLDEDVSGAGLFNMGRLLGETGPLKDFRSRRALLRYAGLNLRERQSGTYRGQTRLSKKGRPLLRKILGQMTFPLLRSVHIYGPYYHRKINEGMTGQKAKVAAGAQVPVYGPLAGP